MDEHRYQAIVERACGDKQRYGWRTARDIAADRRASGDDISAYRCPFNHDDDGGQPHWHLGHVPSMESVHDVVDAIRYQHGARCEQEIADAVRYENDEFRSDSPAAMREETT